VWLAGLRQFAQILQNLPVTLRFDTVKVVNRAQEGDYAHLVLALSNLVTERGTYPELQFRLATVSSGGVFDANPRLEFPRQTGEAVFERWFVESTNAFGENLEVRFAKQDSLVDLPLITAKLKESDARLIGQIVERLPAVMQGVKGCVGSDKAGDKQVAESFSEYSDISNANQPAISLSPAVGRLSTNELAKWEQLALTMRKIWHAQVRL
jgi:hypothetical protein